MSIITINSYEMARLLKLKCDEVSFQLLTYPMTLSLSKLY